MIRFACGKCAERLVVPEQYAGRKGKCPRCGTTTRVPLIGATNTQQTLTPGAGMGAASPSASREPVAGRSEPVAGPNIGRSALPTDKAATTVQKPIAAPAPAAQASATDIDAPPTAPPLRRDGYFSRLLRRREAQAWEDGTAPYDLDAAGMPAGLRLLIAGGIVVLLVLAIWVLVYLLIWFRTHSGVA